MRLPVTPAQAIQSILCRLAIRLSILNQCRPQVPLGLVGLPPASRQRTEDGHEENDAPAGGHCRAARLYKQIMDDLPEQIDGQDVWPSDVKLRYNQARKVLGQK